jgi:hypothetical protein
MVRKTLMPVRGRWGSLCVFHHLRLAYLSRRPGFRRLHCPNPWRRFAATTLPLPHNHRRQEQLGSAAHPRPEAPPPASGAGDLGPAKAESSARGRAGSPLDHVPSAPPPWRADYRKACRQKETGVGLTLYAKADRHRREHLPAKASEAVVAGNEARCPGTTHKDQ